MVEAALVGIALVWVAALLALDALDRRFRSMERKLRRTEDELWSVRHDLDWMKWRAGK